MDIKAKFSISDLQKALKQEYEKIEKAAISRLTRIGRLFVAAGRANGEYMNHTYNLRSSVAFAISKDGVIILQDYRQYGNGSEGLNKAKALMDDVASSNGTGVALIVVAGEDYAIYVESKGKDVLTGSSQLAKAELRKVVKAGK